MSKRMSAGACFPAAVAMVSLVTTVEAQESSGTDTKDLTAVIALQGLPCGQVVSASKQGDDDYVVSCQDGNRYRVVVNKDGRVVVEKR